MFTNAGGMVLSGVYTYVGKVIFSVLNKLKAQTKHKMSKMYVRIQPPESHRMQGYIGAPGAYGLGQFQRYRVYHIFRKYVEVQETSLCCPSVYYLFKTVLIGILDFK